MTNDGIQAQGRGSGDRLTPQEVVRLFDGGYRGIEILPDGTLRETVRGGSPSDETVTRTLKTERTWY
jgi:hypothetical protein